MCVGRPSEHPALPQVQPGAGPNHEENSSQCCPDHPTGTYTYIQHGGNIREVQIFTSSRVMGSHEVKAIRGSLLLQPTGA